MRESRLEMVDPGVGAEMVLDQGPRTRPSARRSWRGTGSSASRRRSRRPPACRPRCRPASVSISRPSMSKRAAFDGFLEHGFVLSSDQETTSGRFFMRIHNLYVDDKGETISRDIQVEWKHEGAAARPRPPSGDRHHLPRDAGHLRLRMASCTAPAIHHQSRRCRQYPGERRRDAGSSAPAR